MVVADDVEGAMTTGLGASEQAAGQNLFAKRAVQHRDGLPRDMSFLSLQVFKAPLDTALLAQLSTSVRPASAGRLGYISREPP